MLHSSFVSMWVMVREEEDTRGKKDKTKDKTKAGALLEAGSLSLRRRRFLDLMGTKFRVFYKPC